jgi:uncharacterized protein
MELLAVIILLGSMVIGLLGVFFSIPGTLLIFLGSGLYAVMTDFTSFPLKFLLILLTLYLLGEGLEYILVIWGSKRFGASNAAVLGAVIGGVVGTILGIPLLGIGPVWGAFLGIFAGAFIVELIIQKDLVKSLRAGAGGVIGRAGAIALKFIIALLMIGSIVFQLLGKNYF